ncbi:GtrA family protein [Glycomyces arizonensis]|uniref:GtrA family protein n=1 Tax=Glycomyces arizonensis TaxID=256035 RepID=UPI00146FA55A|nr:GtrA family protein [Glycomyces arizonensis]
MPSTSAETVPQTPSGSRPRNPITRGWRLLRSHGGELFRFVGVGGTAYCIDVGLFNLLMLGLDWPDWIAKTTATVIATTFAFFGNRYWTWRDRLGSSAAHRQYLLYFFFNGIGLLISLACLWANSGLAQVWPEYFDTVLAKNLAANVIGVGLASTFRFYAYRTWVFRSAGRL